MQDASERLHYMDHLRALAMLAGVAFHAMLAYSPLMHPIFPTADRQMSPAVDGVAWALHLVRMPLFFLVAGFFAAWVIARRGGAALARQRVRRILLPFLVAWPLVWLSLSAGVVWAAENVQHPSPLLAMVRQWLAMPDAPDAPLGTAHLWFLYYLLLFALLHWVARTLEAGRWLDALLLRSPLWILLGLPLLLVPALASVTAPHPAPESVLPQFWALVYYGAFFALGTGVHARADWLQTLRPFVPWLALACGVAYVAFLWGMKQRDAAAAYASASWPLAALEACLGVWGTLLCLWAGQRLLDRPSAVMRYLAQSAYWTYLLHLPLLFAIQYLLMDRDWAWPLKFVVGLGATLGLCLLTYQVFVRHTPLRRFVG
ncbi:acyltransferase family protein [Arenimonas sp. MALMAid1274]|uniref:acyltransferase family protein n=1 Tax=Arenimonas sp. MALMAid1274 TaxID=3411630 RepID=UPI003BA04A0F